MLFSSTLFTEAEQARASHFAQECADEARLTRWLRNVAGELARRQVEADRQRRRTVLGRLLGQVFPAGFRGHYPARPRLAPAWRPGTPLPCRPDYQAGILDRQAAARFQPTDSLACAHLLPIRPQ